MAVMHQLSNIVSAVTHDIKPVFRDYPQLIRMLIHPGPYVRISLGRIGETHESIHRHCRYAMGLVPVRLKGLSASNRCCNGERDKQIGVVQLCRLTISLIQVGAKGEVQPLETG